MKQYNCPDCNDTENTCENCNRYKVYHKSNEYRNIYWPFKETLIFDNIPTACRGCPNHPSNGGTGNCNCVLGTLSVR